MQNFTYGPSITHKDDHFANKCIKIGRKIKEFKFRNLAFVGPFWLSLSLTVIDRGNVNILPEALNSINSKKKSLSKLNEKFEFDMPFKYAKCNANPF